MAIGRSLDLTNQYKANNVYQLTVDVSGWDSVTAHVVAPMTGTVYIYGSNDSGAAQSVTQGNATLVTNFSSIQATNLATGAAVASISAAGLYKVDVNAQFLRLGGGAANVYKMILFESKVD